MEGADDDTVFQVFGLIALSAGATFLIATTVESVTVAAILVVAIVSALFLGWVWVSGRPAANETA